VLDPVVRDGAARPIARVNVLGELGERAAAFRQFGDELGNRRQIGDDAMLEVEGEVGIGGQVKRNAAED
jgi:hypothetical protein